MPELIALSRLTILRLLSEQFALWPPSIYPVRKVSSVSSLLWIETFNNFGFMRNGRGERQLNGEMSGRPFYLDHSPLFFQLLLQCARAAPGETDSPKILEIWAAF